MESPKKNGWFGGTNYFLETSIYKYKFYMDGLSWKTPKRMDDLGVPIIF